jgi:hypothetical protein
MRPQKRVVPAAGVSVSAAPTKIAKGGRTLSYVLVGRDVGGSCAAEKNLLEPAVVSQGQRWRDQYHGIWDRARLIAYVIVESR